MTRRGRVRGRQASGLLSAESNHGDRVAKASSTSTTTARTREPRNPGGGPSASGGYNFQAAVTAIALSHLARGSAIGWLDGVADDVPTEVACETGGAGDDIRLTLANGDCVEIQVKKGLSAGAAQREAMFALADALSRDRIAYGLLVVCPESSRTVASGLANDLIRLGEAPATDVDPLADAFRSRLQTAGMDIRSVCSRLRIITVPALRSNAAGIQAAKAELAYLCERQGDVRSAWNALYRDASLMIETRGIRRIGGVTRTLLGAGLALSVTAASGSAALIARVCAWTIASNDSFSILGVRKKLSIETAWQPQTLVIKSRGPEAPVEAARALDDYHNWNQRGRSKGDETCAADALGRFYRHAVVVAGPGMGKSTLLRRLANHYASDGFPVLIVRARELAAAVQSGQPFEAALFEQGLDGSSLSAAQLRAAPIDDWVVLCDGLDETGPGQDLVAAGLHRFRQGRPSARILATTRPIGYRSHHLRDWRHYEIAGLVAGDVGRHLRRVLDHVQVNPVAREEEDYDFGERVAGDRAVRSLITQSPLMLGLAAAVLSRGGAISGSRTGLFRSLFDLIQSEPSPRVQPAPPAPEILARALDVLGAEILDDPLVPASTMVSRIGTVLASELDLRPLRGPVFARECLDYWEALGLVETVYHDHVAILTTTHLMFAEFAAGRFLAGLDPDARALAVRARSTQDRWAEGLTFAAAEGAGDAVVESLIARGVTGRSGRDRLGRCLDILANARAPLSVLLADNVMAKAHDAMASDDVALACEIALSVVPLAKGRPAEVAALGTRLLNAGRPWSQLAAWTLVTQTGTEHYDLEAAKGALLDILERHRERPEHETGFALSEPEASLLHLLAEQVFLAVLDREPLASAEAFIEPLLKSAGLDHYGFWAKISGPLHRRGSQLNPHSGGVRAGPVVDFGAWDIAAKAAFTALISGAVLPGIPPQPRHGSRPGRSLFHLAALSQHCRWGNTMPGDVWSWKGLTNTRGTEATLQGLIAVAGLDAPAVSREAQVVLQDLNAPNVGILAAVFGRFANIDVQPIDWTGIDRALLDVDGLKLGLVHPSELIAPVATALLDPVLTDDERRTLVPSLLSSPRRLTVFAGVTLALRLPLEEGVEALLIDLGSESPGAVDRVNGLMTIGAPCTGDVFTVLRPLLFGAGPEPASAVADFLKARTPLADDVLAVVVEAETYWRTAEEPYPEGGGSVPSSPRSRLLDIRIHHAQLDLEALLRWATDARHDVRDVAFSGLVGMLRSSPSSRADFARRVGEGAIAAEVMTKTFQSDVLFEAFALAELEGAFGSREVRVRLAAMSALTQPAWPRERRAALLERLRGDVEPLIRSRAARLLTSE